MKQITKALALLSLCAGFIPAAQAGIFGSGNTADSSLQFNFVRSTALMILKNVSARDVQAVSSSADLAKLYEHCRETMYLGLVRTSFELVEQIPDGGRYHALAKRVNKDLIQISRQEVQRLMKNNTLTAPFMTALFLHEVGHDCVWEGKPLDDKHDGMLNLLGTMVVEASGARSFTSYIDIDFVQKVELGKPVVFLDLSEYVRQNLVKKYLDYVGDWAYLQNRSAFTDRPAPASEFYANSKNSWFLGWGSLLNQNQIPGTLQYMVENLLKASFTKQNFAYYAGGNQSLVSFLPTQLSCRAEKRAGVNGASCTLDISWTPLADARFASQKPRLEFFLNIFGQWEVTRLQME